MLRRREILSRFFILGTAILACRFPRA